MEQDTPQSQEVPVDEEYKKTTGHNSVQEHVAYQDGYSNSQQLMLEWIEKWDGSTNSALGQLLAKKMKELSNPLVDTTAEEKAQKYLDSIQHYDTRGRNMVKVYIAGYREALQDSGRRWTDGEVDDLMDWLVTEGYYRKIAQKEVTLPTIEYIQEYKKQQQKS